MKIPAVRGVGGSLIYFVEPLGPLADIWSVDFDLSAGAQPSTDGIGLASVAELDDNLQEVLLTIRPRGARA